jgi:hypothetical protein
LFDLLWSYEKADSDDESLPKMFPSFSQETARKQGGHVLQGRIGGEGVGVASMFRQLKTYQANVVEGR